MLCFCFQLDRMLRVREYTHFTLVCLVTWPLNESEAGVDLTLTETSLLFLCLCCCSHAN